jgi:hypothetical protein
MPRHRAPKRTTALPRRANSRRAQEAELDAGRRPQRAAHGAAARWRSAVQKGAFASIAS